MGIGLILKSERKNQKITQNRIAKHIDVSKYTLSRFETGKVDLKFEKVRLYADYLGFEIRLLKK